MSGMCLQSAVSVRSYITISFTGNPAVHDVVLDHLTLDRSSKEAANYGRPPYDHIFMIDPCFVGMNVPLTERHWG